MSISSPIFGTELLLSTFIIISIEVVILVIQLFYCLIRPKDKTRRSFLLLTITFLLYNIADGLLPDYNLSLNPLIQNIIAYASCIIVASYYFFYLVKELELKLSAFYHPKVLTWVLVITFCLTYLMGYYITEDFTKSKLLFVGFSVLISLYFCFNTIIRLIKMEKSQPQNTPFKLMAYSGYIGIIFMATMPISDAISDNQFYTIILVNVSYFLSAWAYLARYIFQNKVRLSWLEYNQSNQIKQPIEDIAKLLTPREIEVAYMIIQPNVTYSNIASKMYVSHKTISKHASNIFKKTGVKNRKEFIATYFSRV
jgi:DNA-binding CsgD family transcriptional regulator